MVLFEDLEDKVYCMSKDDARKKGNEEEKTEGEVSEEVLEEVLDEDEAEDAAADMPLLEGDSSEKWE